MISAPCLVGSAAHLCFPLVFKEIWESVNWQAQSQKVWSWEVKTVNFLFLGKPANTMCSGFVLVFVVVKLISISNESKKWITLRRVINEGFGTLNDGQIPFGHHRHCCSVWLFLSGNC